MNETTAPADDVEDSLNIAFKSGDVERICLAVGAAIKAYNISDIARKSGLSRPSVYRAFAGGGASPNLTTLLGVLDAMGLRLMVPKRGDRAQASRIRSAN